MRISEKERLTELYYCLKAVPKDLWRSEDYSIVEEALGDKKLDKFQSVSFHIIGRLAHWAKNPEEFIKMLKQNTPPESQLNDLENDVLNEGLKKAAAKISKGEMGKAADSLKIFQAYYAKAS